MFISFDGIDGVGKSTQMEQFVAWLEAAGHTVLVCRDPGSTQLGEAIRGILLNDDGTPISRTSEMFLYMAARAQMVEEVIRPALAEGKTVVSDRFLLANVVYQGYAGGLDLDAIRQTGEIATGGLSPDITFVLDLDPQAAAKRLNRELDRMENQGEEFRTRLRAGYLKEAERSDDHIVVINADDTIEAIQTAIRDAWRQHVS